MTKTELKSQLKEIIKEVSNVEAKIPFTDLEQLLESVTDLSDELESEMDEMSDKRRESFEDILDALQGVAESVELLKDNIDEGFSEITSRIEDVDL